MRILDLREISDYTVERMAAALDVPVEEYRKIEAGEIDIPISFLVKVGEVFHEPQARQWRLRFQSACSAKRQT